MRTVPIVFAFDNKLTLPACICIFSLMVNAREDTFYDIFILSSASRGKLDIDQLNKICGTYPNCRITYKEVASEFDESYEVRGISSLAYYRLLIPELIPQYDTVLYSDVDVIFRTDLSDIYFNTDMDGCYFAGVDSLAHLIPFLKNYYELERKIDSVGNIYSGNLIINSKDIRRDGIVEVFREHVGKKYLFQDMDIINIVCKGKIKYLPPSFCYTTYIADFAVNGRTDLKTVWSEEQIREAQESGIVHFNGPKPWDGACINFDIWWEYYRKSPFFNHKHYYHFFDNMSNELERLPLMKRIKILARYFIYGKKR